MSRKINLILLALFLAMFMLPSNAAESNLSATTELPPGLIVPEAAKPGAAEFQVVPATESYLKLLNAEQRARSDAYFEGAIKLDLVDLIIALAFAALILFGGVSSKWRDLCNRMIKYRFISNMLYFAGYVLLAFLILHPWNWYVGFWREHAYGLATQNYTAWLWDEIKGLFIGIIIGAPLIALLYEAVRKTKSNWWAWAGLISFVTIIFIGMIAPVFISPLFNDYKPLPPSQLRDELLSMARANQIPAENIYVFDASKQTTRISANVSGLFGTTRISLNDNLLKRTSPAEIRAVMGHEMGHYVLNHSIRGVIYLSLLIVLGFLSVHLTADWFLRRYATRWGIADRADIASLPLAAALLGVFFTLVSPIQNSIVRQAEAEADAFGLAAAREPHGFATAIMRLSSYRKIHPGPIEEVLFFDHPSGHTRVTRAMTWLKENQTDQQVQKIIADPTR